MRLSPEGVMHVTELLHRGAIELLKDQPRASPTKAAERSYEAYVRICQQLEDEVKRPGIDDAG